MSNKHEHRGSETHHASRAAWHKDWRAWAVVGVMLAAMAIYVLSIDESVGPAATPDQTEEMAVP